MRRNGSKPVRIKKESKLKLNELQNKSARSEITLRRAEIQSTGSVLKSLGGMYDEHAKLVFLFDVSGSMSERVARDKEGKTFTDQYIWKEEKMVEIRSRVSNLASMIALDPMAALIAASDPLCALLDPPDADGNRGFTADDEELKARIVRADLILELGIDVDRSKHNQQPPTRIELVQKLASQELHARFKKYPNSRMAVIPFANYPAVIFDDGDEAALDPAISGLGIGCNNTDSGGTRILDAIAKAMEVCRKHPSSVGLHHFIVVSDGCDGVCSANIDQWVPTLKASGVVLDYIHIGEDSYHNKGLEAACKALGGEFVVVNTERDFTRRFVEAAQRLCLPPASN